MLLSRDTDAYTHTHMLWIDRVALGQMRPPLWLRLWLWHSGCLWLGLARLHVYMYSCLYLYMAVKSAGEYTYVSFIVFCILSAGRLFGHARVEVCLQRGALYWAYVFGIRNGVLL